jgi:hypothetical protein
MQTRLGAAPVAPIRAPPPGVHSSVTSSPLPSQLVAMFPETMTPLELRRADTPDDLVSATGSRPIAVPLSATRLTKRVAALSVDGGDCSPVDTPQSQSPSCADFDRCVGVGAGVVGVGSGRARAVCGRNPARGTSRIGRKKPCTRAGRLAAAAGMAALAHPCTRPHTPYHAYRQPVPPPRHGPVGCSPCLGLRFARRGRRPVLAASTCPPPHPTPHPAAAHRCPPPAPFPASLTVPPCADTGLK